MALSNAERQRRYRQGRKEAYQGEGDRQLNVFIRGRAYSAIERLAAHYGVTKRTMIERLALEADEAVTRSMEPGGPEWEAYFGTPLSRQSLE